MAIVNGRPIAADPRLSPVTERVVVKLRTGVPQPPGVTLAEALGTAWMNVASRYPGTAVTPYFTTGNTAGAPPPSFASLLDRSRYLAVEVPRGTAAAAVAEDLRREATVEYAYLEGGPTPPPVNPGDDPRSANQEYLSSAPAGVDAHWAWSSGAVDGTGVGFVDLEQGWTLDHEDLVAAGISVISGLNHGYHGHGTSVLGQVVAIDNVAGGIGIAPRATTRVVSQWRTTSRYSTADAIASAAEGMRVGDVLLLEAQTTYPTAADRVPVEVEDLVFEAIRATVARGVVVVEAGGNGAIDLDQFQDLQGRRILNRNSTDFRESGAIMVGAGSATVPHHRLPFSNFGSRIDCFAWGEHIDTCGDGWIGQGLSTYTTDFGGTSGSSPIVTGCALLLQAFRLRATLPPYTPLQLRALLSDPAINTSSANPGDLIGVMPNLRAIIEQQQLAPLPPFEIGATS